MNEQLPVTPIREATFGFLLEGGSATLVAVSDEVQALLGHAAEDFRGGRVTLPQIVHADDRDVADMLWSPVPTSTAGVCNLRLRQADGRVLCAKGHYRREPAATGLTLELRLQDAKSLPRTMADATTMPAVMAIMEITDDYIYFKDRNHVITGASQTLVTLTAPAEHWTDLIGLTDYDVFPEHLADRYYSLEKQVFAGRPIAHEVQETLSRTGESGWVDNRKYPIRDASGDLIGLYGIARDITALKRAEAELARATQLLERTGALAKVGGWQVDLPSNRLTWTAETFRIAEIEPPVEPPLADGINLFAPEARPIITAAIERTIETGMPYDLELPLITAKGRHRWVQTQGYADRQDGKTVRLFGTFQDITDRKQMEHENAQIEAQLRQSQRLETVGTLAAGIAHDFNNILGAILGNAEEALADTEPAHPAHERLTEIRTASIRAGTLVQQVLTFSSQQPSERQPLAIGPVITEVAKLLHATIPPAVEIVTTVDAEAPMVLANVTQMHQILINLCTNAWHAIGDRPGCIEVHLGAATLNAEEAGRIGGLAAGRFACLSVRDDGEGMDAATLERIFDPFFTTKEPGKGTGLGLSVVHGIVKQLDGAIHVASRPGEGTTFTLYFPVDAPAPVQAAPGVMVPAVTAATAGPHSNRHILYLEDDAMLRRIGTRMLQRLGFHVTGFARPTNAVKAFRDNPGQFDLVLTDMHMPESTGLVVANQLRSVRADVPIMLVSGSKDEALQQSARGAGIAHVLGKPFTISELGDAIARLTPDPTPRAS